MPESPGLSEEGSPGALKAASWDGLGPLWGNLRPLHSVLRGLSLALWVTHLLLDGGREFWAQFS